MITINKEQLETFFMSIGWTGDYEDPESIHGGIIRARKEEYIHLPMMKLECKTKKEFLDRIEEIAEGLWDRMEKSRR